MHINQAKHSNLESFFEYLARQLSENGTDATPLFQPVSCTKKAITPETRAKFIDGFSTDFGTCGWRKLWLAKHDNGKIVGHMDLRHYSHAHSFHRVLLGMGVDSNYRKQGIGVRLVKTAWEFCNSHEAIDWLDLNVLTTNLPAKHLYEKFGFQVIGEMADLFRIDSISVGELTMPLPTSTATR